MSEVRDDPGSNYLRTAFEAAHERVLALIDRFHAHADAYLQPSYQEAETRKDFIDPLLKALGWDVDHEREHNPYEQEVKVERGVSVARSQKRADYAFYLAPNFRDVRFFVEAKKPSIDLDRSADAHFQTWRYGYSANTPLAVLTDFEQVRVLDCRARPTPEAALDRVWKRWHYTDFRDKEKFAEFYWLFSREAHADGSFQRRVDELSKPRGGAKQRGLFRGGYQPVDESFLAELEEHREALAKAFKKADHTLDSDRLTEIVQRTLDRLVFLRFLEDKQIETDIRVSDFGKGASAWADFVAASRRLDGIYNGIVFKRLPPLDDAQFDVDDEVFSGVCEKLAAENSPFNFDAIPIHILGSIYERFLGSVIRATAQRVVIEQKPEVRKAGGVYYTPEYIVRYIVAHTVGKLIAGKSPGEIAQLRFADIACGSGSFLLGVYDELLRRHAEWYNDPANDKAAKKDGCVKGEDSRWRLSLAQRRAILMNNVYGVDIDHQAVEVAQLSLFLKLLEDERAVSARQYQLDYARDANLKKLLPDLSRNIVCGNSLIGWDIAGMLALDPDDKRRLNPLDFEQAFPAVMRRGGFDVIVGNPPYVLLQDAQRDTTSYDYLREKFEAASYKLDTYHLFMERALKLLRKGGLMGYITPTNYLTNNHVDALRRFLLSQNRIIEIIAFTDAVFAGASVDTAITIVAAAQPTDTFAFALADTESQDVRIARTAQLEAKACLADPKALISLSASVTSNISRQLILGSVPLGEIVDVNFGKQLRDRKKFTEDVIKVDSLRAVPKSYVACITGKDVNPYLLRWSGLACLNDRVAQSGGCWDEAKHDRVPKLITRQIGRHPSYALDDVGFHCLNTVFMLTTKNIGQLNLKFILGLLNSHLMAYFWEEKYFDQRQTFPKIKGTYLKQLPIRRIDFSNAADRKRHDAMVSLVDSMLAARQREAQASGERDREIAQRECAALDRRIDALVYELYGLTAEEIELVESVSP